MREEDRYRALVESIPEGVWILDADHRTTFVNEAMARMMGRDRDELLGHPPSDFVPERNQGRLAEALERRRQGVRERYEIVLARRDGSEIIAEISATPVFDEAGAYDGSTAVIADMTERRREQHEREARDVDERLLHLPHEQRPREQQHGERDPDREREERTPEP